MGIGRRNNCYFLRKLSLTSRREIPKIAEIIGLWWRWLTTIWNSGRLRLATDLFWRSRWHIIGGSDQPVRGSWWSNSFSGLGSLHMWPNRDEFLSVRRQAWINHIHKIRKFIGKCKLGLRLASEMCHRHSMPILWCNCVLSGCQGNLLYNTVVEFSWRTHKICPRLGFGSFVERKAKGYIWASLHVKVLPYIQTLDNVLMVHAHAIRVNKTCMKYF